MLCVCFLQVSWIRYKDTSLLTVGRYTYTTDLRFEAFHSPHTDDWIVRLKNPRPSDSGFYGCQISTTPHRTQLVYLTVHGRSSSFCTHKYLHLFCALLDICGSFKNSKLNIGCVSSIAKYSVSHKSQCRCPTAQSSPQALGSLKNPKLALERPKRT